MQEVVIAVVIAVKSVSVVPIYFRWVVKEHSTVPAWLPGYLRGDPARKGLVEYAAIVRTHVHSLACSYNYCICQSISALA